MTIVPATARRRAGRSSPGTLRLLLRNPVSLAGSAVLLGVAVAALLGPTLAPYGVNETDVTRALQPPSGAHWFGTDDLGRDVFSRVLVAARVSVEVALVSVGISLVVGVGLGLLSGYVGGLVDGVLMRVIDVLFAFPVLSTCCSRSRCCCWRWPSSRCSGPASGRR